MSSKIRNIKQGDVFMVNFKDSVENEEYGIRPCVCVSCNSLNGNRKNIIVAPITSAKKKKMINHYTLPADKYDFFLYNHNTVLLECLRDISKKRLERKLGSLDYDDIGIIIEKVFYDFVDSNKERENEV